MKTHSKKAFRSFALAAAAVLSIASSAVQASACSDNCTYQANQAAAAAYSSTYAQQYGICYQMAPGPARDTCFSQVPMAASSAYGQAWGQTYAACMSNTQCRG
jgi:hypothetical protein